MQTRTARLAGIVALLLGCSCGGSSGGGSPEAGQDAAPKEASAHESGSHDAGSESDASDAHETSADAPSDTGSAVDSAGAGSGPCASCTAMMCPTQLEACAGSEACTNALVTFNDCFTAPSLGASCGAAFAMAGPEASAMWACMSTMCKSTCL
jgi:hypothetical protein